MRAATAFAPGRVNLMGEHTDYHGGRCLPMAIGLGVTATARPAAEWSFASRQRPDDAWTTYPRAVVAALAEAGLEVGPCEVTVEGDVPEGAGLSSSAALECAVAVALTAAAGHELDDHLRALLVAVCRSAENDHVGAPTGGLDQTTSMWGRAGHALLLDFSDGSRTSVRWGGGAPAVLVVDTRTTHALADGGGYAERAEEARQIAAHARAGTALPAVLERRRRHVVTENARVLEAANALETGAWSRLGELFLASHASLRDDYEVSCLELDVAVEAAVEGGALGARLTGAGFGGSAIALAPHDGVAEVQRAVSAAFAERAWRAPAFHQVDACDGARVLP